MSIETDLVTLLKVQCQRVFPDVAPANTAKPYVTWQGLGGESARYLDNTAADKRNTLLQVNAWAATRLEALALIRQIEDAICASPEFIARPQGEAVSVYEDAPPLYGCVQRFSIWATR